MIRGMTKDYTWANAATQYEQIIEWAFIDPPYCWNKDCINDPRKDFFNSRLLRGLSRS